jgi:hypothetical protein
MQTQDYRCVPDILAHLDRLAEDGCASAVTEALRADMARVAGNAGFVRSDPDRCLEIAYRAQTRDPMDAFTRLALGYALLNADGGDGAAAHCVSDPGGPAPSTAADMRLLAALTGADAPDADDGAPSAMGVYADCVRAFRAGRFDRLVEIAGSGPYASLLWPLLFEAAGRDRLGDARCAARAAKRIDLVFPYFGAIADRVVRGMFPDRDQSAALLEPYRRHSAVRPA